MKNIFFVLALVVAVSGCVVLGGSIQGGGDVFFGTGQGYRGEISVQVFMDGGNIIEIVIVNSKEDRFVGGEAMEELIDMVIMYNTTELDAISGATETSKGFLEAVRSAILNE